MIFKRISGRPGTWLFTRRLFRERRTSCKRSRRRKRYRPVTDGFTAALKGRIEWGIIPIEVEPR